ncbi:unnamed protein product [Colias eurytheme]|nr:unnamed protein product [Colias eurytheme]
MTPSATRSFRSKLHYLFILHRHSLCKTVATYSLVRGLEAASLSGRRVLAALRPFAAKLPTFAFYIYLKYNSQIRQPDVRPIFTYKQGAPRVAATGAGRGALRCGALA